jgi:hypothetical protein
MGKAFFRDIVELAQFCAELTRQGIAYRAAPCSGGWEVELTGY